MMNGGDLHELAKLLGHANIKMTERYAKLGRAHITKSGNTAKVIWSTLNKRKTVQEEDDVQDHRSNDGRVLVVCPQTRSILDRITAMRINRSENFGSAVNLADTLSTV